MNTTLHPERTAITRKQISRPMRDFDREYIAALPWGSRILDYGCGHGQDVAYLSRQGMDAMGYDRYQGEFMFRPFGVFDVVMCNYVLNVIPTERKRLDVLRDAWSFVKPGGRLLVSTRPFREVEREAEKNGWRMHEDGWVTSRDTFQCGFDRWRLGDYVSYATGESALHISVGKPYTAVLARKPS